MRTLVALSLMLLVGCTSSPPAATPTPPAPPPSDGAAVSTPPPPASASASGTPVVVPEGAAVKAPIFSDDACSDDKDCVPMNTCHPDRCVLAAHAGTLPTGMMCTMDCRGGTLDCGFNHCGCATPPGATDGKKKCAVLPGAGRPKP